MIFLIKGIFHTKNLSLLVFCFFVSLTMEVHSEVSCGYITKIWDQEIIDDYGMEQSIQSSNYLIIHHDGFPRTASVGDEICESDQIQADLASISFEITWNTDSDEKSISLFKASEGKPVHIQIEKCDGEFNINFNADVLGIINKKNIKKIINYKTKFATAGICGTIFRIKQLDNGNRLKVMVLNGQICLRNDYGTVTISVNQEGTAIYGTQPNVITVDKKYIYSELYPFLKRQNISPSYHNELPQFIKSQDHLFGPNNHKLTKGGGIGTSVQIKKTEININLSLQPLFKSTPPIVGEDNSIPKSPSIPNGYGTGNPSLDTQNRINNFGYGTGNPSLDTQDRINNFGYGTGNPSLDTQNRINNFGYETGNPSLDTQNRINNFGYGTGNPSFDTQNRIK